MKPGRLVILGVIFIVISAAEARFDPAALLGNVVGTFSNLLANAQGDEDASNDNGASNDEDAQSDDDDLSNDGAQDDNLSADDINKADKNSRNVVSRVGTGPFG